MKLLKIMMSAISISLMTTGSALAGVDVSPGLSPLLFDGLGGFMVAGMLINKQAIDSVFIGLKTIFNKALTATSSNWQETAMEVQSGGKGEDYAWLERFPKFRKWVGEKAIKSLSAGKYYVKNEPFETTIEVDRDDIEDDSLGLYNTQSQMAGESAGELHEIIIDDLKNNAFTATCIDGQYFYDTDHPIGDGSYSNKGTLALSNATRAAADASYGAARVAIQSFKDSEGMPLKLMPTVLEVPPALEAMANTLMKAPKLGDDSPNPYQGTAKVVVNMGLISTTAWFLHCANKPVKPFIVQMRKAPVFVSQTNMDSDDVFLRAKYKFGAEARAAGVYGFPQTSYGSTGLV